jgi:hypothetical protein
VQTTADQIDDACLGESSSQDEQAGDRYHNIVAKPGESLGRRQRIREDQRHHQENRDYFDRDSLKAEKHQSDEQ